VHENYDCVRLILALIDVRSNHFHKADVALWFPAAEMNTFFRKRLASTLILPIVGKYPSMDVGSRRFAAAISTLADSEIPPPGS